MAGIVNQPALVDLPRVARRAGQSVSATATTEGTVELATQAEVDTGTDTGRVVTPATLDGFIDGKADTVITASDAIAFADATDSDAAKKDTIQGILDLADFKFVSTAAITAATSLEVNGLVAGYDYIINIEAFSVTDDGEEMWMRFSDDGVPTYEVGAADYNWRVVLNSTGIFDASDAQIKIAGTGLLGFDASSYSNLEITLINPMGTSEPTQCFWLGHVISDSNLPTTIMGIAEFKQGNDNVTDVEFLLSGGSTFKAQGDITVRRRKRS